ncbi:MAG: isoprenylcysteine carboxylmethyltransferase family protein [Gammaproteobacteria bacterium]|nr:isoprenylcysteine carboxylmethyltransferase family protein [Gammaproteobacteria bacterium]NNL49422.1 isoprenylcysteine carboxylmethyltransferase family protein [Woeseiaceae bacterium]
MAIVRAQQQDLTQPGAASSPGHRRSPHVPQALRLTVVLIAAIAVFAVIVLWPAGRLGWVAGWIYIGIVTLYFLANLAYLERVNPELIEARMRMGKGTKSWDIVWGIVFGPILLAVYVVAGLDAIRFEWSTMSPLFWPIGLILFVSGVALLSWSMGVNPFFEKTVRIQTERDHRVIDTGPYALVRHPGYVGLFGWCVSAPFLLGSWWAFVPAMLSVVGLVVRTALEDRTLRQELEGYAAYSQRVRYRLFPGVW